VSLTAGGYPVHRVAKNGAPAPTRFVASPEPVSILERYQDLAAVLHRTAIAPRGELYLWGCTCGALGIVHEPGLRAAQLVSARHVLDKANEMYETLEGKAAHELPKDAQL
jgi:hypothetical protein